MVDYGQNTLSLKKGMVIDSLLVPETNTSFSIYLPKAFDLNKNWPVIIGFNSNKEVDTLTRLFKTAAEESGYIVAISNFSKNQELKEQTKQMSSFIDHIFSLFPIQRGRVYVTGIHEDAKLASMIPALYSEDVFGVIAIGDSHYYDSKIKIGKNFSYIGILNTTNYRYKDFLKNKTYLNRKAIAADIYTYIGESDMPDPDLLTKSLSTFTLQAMLKGRMPKDSIWVQNLFQKDLKEVETNLSKRNFVVAYDDIKWIQNRYRLFFDTSYLKEKEKQIRQLKSYKKEKRLRSKYTNQEGFLRQEYLFSMEEDVVGKQYDNLGWWQYQVSLLDTLVSRKEKYGSNMAFRMKGYLKYLIKNYEVALTEKQEDFEKRMLLNVLGTIVDKKDFEFYSTIISLSAQDQDYETALFYLEKLLVNGFKDIDALYNIEGTLALKISRDYNKLIKKHLGSSKYLFSE